MANTPFYNLWSVVRKFVNREDDGAVDQKDRLPERTQPNQLLMMHSFLLKKIHTHSKQ